MVAAKIPPVASNSPSVVLQPALGTSNTPVTNTVTTTAHRQSFGRGLRRSLYTTPAAGEHAGAKASRSLSSGTDG